MIDGALSNQKNKPLSANTARKIEYWNTINYSCLLIFHNAWDNAYKSLIDTVSPKDTLLEIQLHKIEEHHQTEQGDTHKDETEREGEAKGEGED